MDDAATRIFAENDAAAKAAMAFGAAQAKEAREMPWRDVLRALFWSPCVAVTTPPTGTKGERD